MMAAAVSSDAGGKRCSWVSPSKDPDWFSSPVYFQDRADKS